MIGNPIDTERLIHSFKTAIACIVGYLVTRLIGLPADQWIVVTIIVVMSAQIFVGSVYLKAYLRFLGTLAGCLVASLAITTLGNTHFVAALTIGLASFFFSYIATERESLSYAGTLGAVTTAIIMLGHNPTIIFAVERFLEITLGLIIATVISQFILPIHARTHLRRAQATTLEHLRDYFISCMNATKANPNASYYQEMDENIVKTLSKQRQLAKEAARERLGKFYDPKHFIQTLHYEKEMLRAIDFMHHAMVNLEVDESFFIKSPELDKFNDTIIQSLNTLIRVVESDQPEKEHLHIPSAHKLQEELQKNINPPSTDKMIYIDGFLFSAEMMTRSLNRLGLLYKIPTKKSDSM